MNQPTLVQIIAAPIACAEGVTDSWRDVARWAEGQLKARFVEAAQVEYLDLFDADCPTLPANAQLPVVLVNDEVTTNGGEIALPGIWGKI